jgi:hypothetical protein
LQNSKNRWVDFVNVNFVDSSFMFFLFFFRSANIYLDVHYVHNMYNRHSIYQVIWKNCWKCFEISMICFFFNTKGWKFCSNEFVTAKQSKQVFTFFYKKYLQRHLFMYTRLLFDDSWISYFVKILLNCVKHERTSFPFCLFPRT